MVPVRGVHSGERPSVTLPPGPRRCRTACRAASWTSGTSWQIRPCRMPSTSVAPAVVGSSLGYPDSACRCVLPSSRSRVGCAAPGERRLEGLPRCMTEDAVDRNKIIRGGAAETGAAFGGLRQQLAAFDPLVVRVEGLPAEGDRVVARVTRRGTRRNTPGHTGTHRGTRPRMPAPTGRREARCGPLCAGMEGRARAGRA
ncbi:nuclear transport factor 2 family protein [Streptomyces sp. MK7]|uniref:nuclear transport factor 2 family protein n=1 Tax=Streptomyces sp. MK7 TaxID=3067635 RepID=UPI00292FD43A|nr:nuclear transport factor 2 family protein [Streptomyces sp. MK7]